MRLPLAKKSIRRRLAPEPISPHACASKLVLLVALVAPPYLEKSGSSPARRVYPVPLRRARRSQLLILLSKVHLDEQNRCYLLDATFVNRALPTTLTHADQALHKLHRSQQ